MSTADKLQSWNQGTTLIRKRTVRMIALVARINHDEYNAITRYLQAFGNLKAAGART